MNDSPLLQVSHLLARLCYGQRASLTPTMYLALLALAKAPKAPTPPNLSYLRDTLGLEQATTSELVTRLERAGLIEKRRRPRDIRHIEIRVTEDGRERMRRFAVRFQIELGKRLAHLSDAEKARLGELLEGLSTLLGKEE